MNEMIIFGVVVVGLILITWLAEKQQNK